MHVITMIDIWHHMCSSRYQEINMRLTIIDWQMNRIEATIECESLGCIAEAIEFAGIHYRNSNFIWKITV